MNGKPCFHPTEDLLLEYASGGLPEAPSLLLATHASTCAPCRHELTRLDEIGGALMSQIDPDTAPGALPADLKKRVMEKLARTGFAAPVSPVVSRPDAVLPEPLRSYAGGDWDEIEWTWLAPGVTQASIPLQWGSEPLRLVRLRSGFVIPSHKHTGRELTLVLSGELTDEHGSYRRGDVSDYDDAVMHCQRVTSQEPCICLIANDGRIVPQTFMGRVLARIAGI